MLDKWLKQKFSKKQRQWVWFVILWSSGFLAATTLGYFIRILMGIQK